MKTRFISIIISIVLIISLIAVPAEAETKPEVNIGDYIQFGRYYGKPILWRVINKDDSGDPMLFSEYILTNRTYDAAESGKEGSTGGSYTTDISRQRIGSNKWENSNMREWLQSADQKVKYTTQPPSKSSVYKGINAHEDEPGFIFNFTQAERNAIKPVTHIEILSVKDNPFKLPPV